MWAQKHLLLLRDVGVGIGVMELVAFLSAVGLCCCFFNDGCVELGAMWAQKHLLLLRDVGVGIGVMELVAFLSAVCLFCCFKDDEKAVYDTMPIRRHRYSPGTIRQPLIQR